MSKRPRKRVPQPVRGKRLGRDMRQVTVYLKADQLDALREISERDMVPMAALIRYGIDRAIDWADERHEALSASASGTLKDSPHEIVEPLPRTGN